MQLAKTFDWEAHFLVPVSPILQFSVREISALGSWPKIPWFFIAIHFELGSCAQHLESLG